MIAAAAEIVLAGAAATLLLSTSALGIQASAAMFRRDRPLRSDGEAPPCLVLVPAHDEAAGIAATVRALLTEMKPGDRILVVADNCTDDTAARAKAAGAEILERTDAKRRGKGYALAAGLQHAHDASMPPVVVFIDADCRFAQGGLRRLVSACSAAGAPVQCRNLMVRAPLQKPQSRLSEFASRLRNDFRPTGYARLGLPCQLFGTGMAMPARLATPERFATGHVTEDLLIGVEAALAGTPPRYVREASVFSHFPDTEAGAAQQKKRWVQGHMAVIASHAPRLLALGLWRGSPALLAMGLDLLTPPLTLLAAGHLGTITAALLCYLLTGGWLPLAIAVPALVLFLLALAAAWRFCGRGLIGWREIREAPRHAVQVGLAALGVASGRRTGWARADRTRLR